MFRNSVAKPAASKVVQVSSALTFGLSKIGVPWEENAGQVVAITAAFPGHAHVSTSDDALSV